MDPIMSKNQERFQYSDESAAGFLERMHGDGRLKGVGQLKMETSNETLLPAVCAFTGLK